MYLYTHNEHTCGLELGRAGISTRAWMPLPLLLSVLQCRLGWAMLSFNVVTLACSSSKERPSTCGDALAAVQTGLVKLPAACPNRACKIVASLALFTDMNFKKCNHLSICTVAQIHMLLGWPAIDFSCMAQQDT